MVFRWLTIGVVSALLIAVGLGVAASARATVGATEMRPAAPSSAPAASAPPERTPASYVGVVMSDGAVDVVSRLEGRLVDVPVRLADRVHAGDVLARIEQVHLKQELQLAGTALAQATLAVKRSESEAAESARLSTLGQNMVDAGVASEESARTAGFGL